jgi:endoglucanase
MRKLTAILLIFAMTVSLCPLQTVSASAMRDITTMELVRDMGLGINLGNTFEATVNYKDAGTERDWIRRYAGGTVNAFETAWGSPTVTKSMIDGYKAAGFKTVRIPVAWSNRMGDNYTICPDYTARVKEVTEWVLGNGMYAVINIHWDGGWWDEFPTDYDESMLRYTRLWEQIADTFKDYGDYLLFESANEELGWNSLWEPWTPAGEAKNRSYQITNDINQAFTDIVRGSGGNNPHRHLLIAGYQTDIERTIDPLFVMPNDPRGRSAVKVHYYDPFGFTHLERDESWARMTMTWGTASETAHLERQTERLAARFIGNGIPVVIGEYGFASNHRRTEEEIRNYTLAVTKAMFDRGMCPILWDVQLEREHYYYNRNIPGLVDPLLLAGLREIAGLPRLTDPRDEYSYSINDALEILKHLAKLSVLNAEQTELYDFFGNGGITINNALEILKHLARLDSLIRN